MSEVAQSQSVSTMIVAYFRGFAVLKETRREYWGLQAINILDNAAYMSLYGIAVVFFSADFGLNDVDAGYLFSAFTLGVTISLFVTGFVSDWLGIRTALCLSMAVLLVLRGLLMLAGLSLNLPGRTTIAAGALIAMAPCVAMTITTYQAANRRFTTNKSRGAGFNLWYLFMNVGFFCGGLSIDVFRKWLKLANSYILGFAIVATVACLLIAIFSIRNETQLYGPDETPDPHPVAQRRKKPWDLAWDVLTESVFWRFLVLCALLLGVRAVFLYLHLLWPKYWLRVIGPDAAIGALQAVNPALVAAGLILLIPMLNRFTVYGMLTYGAIISALSLFVLAIPSHGNATYLTTLACLVVLTIGEVIWSPRLQEYTAAIAPKGQEGTYLGLSMVPWFAAKMTVSMLSGHMLTRWVPAYTEGEPILRDRLAAGQIAFMDSPSALWLILGAFALGGPLIALLLRNWFTKGAEWTPREGAP